MQTKYNTDYKEKMDKYNEELKAYRLSASTARVYTDPGRARSLLGAP